MGYRSLPNENDLRGGHSSAERRYDWLVDHFIYASKTAKAVAGKSNG